MEELHDLIERAMRGNQQAFAELVRRYKGDVFRHAYGMLGDRMDAEDAAQEAFVRAYRSLAKLEHAHAFASWLTRIVANVCYDRLEQRNREEKARRDAAPTNGAPDEIERRGLRLDIREALQRLSVEHREVVLLRDVQGYRYEEIAELLAVPVGTVKSRIHAARLLLKAELEQKE